MDNLERNWIVFFFWLLFVILLSLLHVLKRISVKKHLYVYRWPPGKHRSYKRRLRRRYFKTLFVSVLAAFAAAGMWYLIAVPK